MFKTIESIVRRKILEWLLKDGLPKLKVGNNTVTIDDESITLASLTSNPTLEKGKIWFRGDTGKIMWSPDGATAKEVSDITAEDVWTYSRRRLTVSIHSSPTDTNEYFTSNTSYTKVATEKVNFGVANAIIHIVRVSFSRYSRTEDSSSAAYSRIKIAGNPYCEGKTNNTYYVQLVNESVADLYVKTDSNGEIAVDVELYSEDSRYRIYVTNIVVKIWGIIIEPE
ncbi:MAG: hypothetical protein NDF55_10450 [archaeon GB-1867-005]|nr:hypothetical protein [Candidatus Culexmicrobium cathedralense]